VLDLNGALGGTSGQAAWTVGAGAVSITEPDATVNDPDGTTLASMTATITAGGHASNVLSFDTTGTSISGSYNAGSGVLTLVGLDTEANYQTVLRTIKYNNSVDPGVNSITVSVVANDGIVTGPAQVSVITVNLPLVVDLAATAGLDYTSTWINGGPTNIADATSATVVDTVDGSPDSITIQITNPHVGDILSATDSGGVTSSWDATNNRMTLTGAAPAADYQTVLRTVKYDNTNGGPGVSVNVGEVNISVIGVSGAVTSRTATALVYVPPVVDLNGTTGTQNTGNNFNATWTNAGAVSITDTDATIINPGRPNLLYMTVKITQNGTNGITEFHVGDVLTANTAGTTISQTYSNGVLTLTGLASAAQYQTVLRTIKYNNTNGGPGAGAQVFVEFLADNDDNESGKSVVRTATININVPLVVDLNGGVAGTGFINTATPWRSFVNAAVTGVTNVINPTITTGAEHNIVVGQFVTIRDVVGATGVNGTFAVTSVPTPTTFTLTMAAPGAYTSGGTVAGYEPPLDIANARITDTLGAAYGPNLTSMTATIGTDIAKSGGVKLGDILTATTLVGGITQSYNSITGVLTLSGTTTSANYQTVLRSIRYDNNNLFGGPGADFVYIWFVGRDATNVSNAALGQLDINSREDIDLNGPTNVGNNYTTTWFNNGPVNLSTIDATVKDGDRNYLTAMTAVISNPSAGDALSAVVTGTNIDVQGIGSTQLLFNAKPPLNVDELVNWQTVLRTIQYFNTLGGPAGSQVFVNFTYTDGFSPAGALRTTTIVIDVNEPPALDLNGGAGGTGYATTWTDGGAVSITDAAAATVTDVDSPTLASVTASIATGSHAQNVLSANTAGTSISQNYNAGTGVLTLSGVDSVANYQTVLRSIKYDNSGTGPGVGSVTVNFVANDGFLNSSTVTSTITINTASVVGRRLFYNQSGTAARYDGNNLAINASDDNAIATDKTAYLWEAPGAATFANVSSYSKGINGIMVDISGSHPNITADDFIFRVGNNNSPGLWGTANAPSSVSVRAGAGTSGSDRVVIIWAPGTAPTKQWLNVIVLANADTGLAQAAGYPVGHGDQFFFGNALGNSGLGDTAILATVNATDELGARNNPANLAANIPVTNLYDYDRNAQVNAADQLVSRNNATNGATVLRYLNLTSAPAAPEADGGDEISPLVATDSGVASALTAPAAQSDEVKIPGWLKNRLDSIDLNSGVPAKVFQQLHDVNTPGSRKLLQRINEATDSLGLDDTLLEELLADLGL
jgi:hypothetical protein